MRTVTIALAAFVSAAAVTQRANQGDTSKIPGFIGNEVPPPKMNVPEGFTPIFNGKDLTGWHVSKTNHHGITPDYHVTHGLIIGTQRPLGSGGILLTDKKYKNVEIYMEVKPDWGCDSGLFLRSNEAGDAYQVTLDYLPTGAIGAMYGEGLDGVNDQNNRPGSQPTAAQRPAQSQRGSQTPKPPSQGLDVRPHPSLAWVKAWKRE